MKITESMELEKQLIESCWEDDCRTYQILEQCKDHFVEMLGDELDYDYVYLNLKNKDTYRTQKVKLQEIEIFLLSARGIHIFRYEINENHQLNFYGSVISFDNVRKIAYEFEKGRTGITPTSLTVRIYTDDEYPYFLKESSEYKQKYNQLKKLLHILIDKHCKK